MDNLLLSLPLRGDLRAGVVTARKSGFDAVTLRHEDVKALSASGAREVQSLLRRQSLGLAGVRWDVPGRALVPPAADVDRVVDGLRRALETARLLGAGRVLCDLGPLPPGPSAAKPAAPTGMAGLLLLPTAAEVAALVGSAKPAPERRAGQEQAVDEALAEAGRWADRTGVALAVGSTLAGSAALARTLAACDAPGIGLDLDPAALLPGNASALLCDHADRLLHVRARDATAGEAGRTKSAPLGEGDVDWSAFVATLIDASYAGPMTVEGPPSGVSVLRRLMA